MKPSLPALALAAVLAAPAHAADTYTVDVRHTFPVFEVNHLGFSTQRGRFNRTEGRISLDLAAKKGSVELTIDAASIDMGIDKWDEFMRSEDYFNTARFPTMSYKSDKLIFDGDKVVGAEGSFTLLGVTRPLKLTLSNFGCGIHPMNKKALCAADVSGSIRRSDFGMVKNLPAVGDEVKLLIPVEAFKD